MTTPPLAANLESVARAICAARGLTFVRYVGAGAFKQTFEVDQGGASYALKVYNTRNSPERAAREIEAMTRCTHAHIGCLAAIDEYEDASGRFAFSLEEYLGGGTLSARLLVELMRPTEVHTFGTALIDAVAHIACLDLVHRDLKPDNIMFRADGVTPVVVDFGLVRDLNARSLTQTHVMQGPGTPLFAPPEQLLNAKGMIDWRADQFSLGVVLSYCAFGKHPYQAEGDGPLEIVTRVVERADPVPAFTEAATAAGLQALVRMVAPWPVQRFRTPEALARTWAEQHPADHAASGAASGGV